MSKNNMKSPEEKEIIVKRYLNGESADDIAKRKGLRYREDILDNMGSEELAANLFRISQTESKLKRDNVTDKKDANETNYNIGKNIREFRKSNNLTQRQLADILNTTHSVIWAYETGKTMILTAFAYQMCKKFGLSMDWLCGRTKNSMD